MHHPTNWFMRILLVILVAALLFLVPAALGAGSLSVDGTAGADLAAEGTVSGDVPPEVEEVQAAAADLEGQVDGETEGLPVSSGELKATAEGATSVATEAKPSVQSESTDDITILSKPVSKGDVATAGAVVATTAASAGALFWLKNGIGLALSRFLGAPLFSRLSKDSLLENDGRETLFGLVDQNPGIGLSELADQSGLGWGTTVYHLGRLEQAGFITSMKNGQARHFFKNGHPAAKSKKAVAVLKNETAAQVARFLLATPGATGQTIAKGLGIAPPTVTKYVQRLEAEGLVETLKEGRSKIVQPTDALTEAMLHVDVPMPKMPVAEKPVTDRAISAYA